MVIKIQAQVYMYTVRMVYNKSCPIFSDKKASRKVVKN